MIKLVVFDIDGVLSDGSLIVDADGREQKRINLKDIDAIYTLHREGYKIAAVTGEDSEIVAYFERRFPWDVFCKGIKEKKQTLADIAVRLGVTMEETCFIGDGKYDVGAIRAAGVGACPADAITDAKKAADIILHNPGGHGCVWELADIIKAKNDAGGKYQYFYSRAWEHTRIFKTMLSDHVLMEQVMQVGDDLAQILAKGGQLLLCGNGGSASDAQHIATEFVSRFYKERPGMNAEALTVNTSTLTAVGNDYSFERVFVRQLEAKARPGDMLIGISTSGRSKNVLEAMRYAKEKGLCTVMLQGENVAPHLEDMVDYIIRVPSTDTPRIQEAHIFIGHLLAEYVESEMVRAEQK